MKRRFCFFLFCLALIAVQIYGYRPLIASGKLWANLLATEEGTPSRTTFVKFEYDSIALDYKIMLCQDSSAGWTTHSMHIFEDSCKVYLKQGDSAHLLYDFNLNIGDSFSTQHVGVLKVIAVDKYVTGADSLKVIMLKSELDLDTAIWIEGIGSLGGVLNNSGNIGLIGGKEYLLCHFNQGNLLYHNQNYDSCYYSDKTSISVSAKEKRPAFAVYPAPFNPSLTITFDNPRNNAQVNIYNIAGRRVFALRNIYGNKLEWVPSNLATGIYAIELQMDGRIYKSRACYVK